MEEKKSFDQNLTLGVDNFSKKFSLFFRKKELSAVFVVCAFRSRLVYCFSWSFFGPLSVCRWYSLIIGLFFSNLFFFLFAFCQKKPKRFLELGSGTQNETHKHTRSDLIFPITHHAICWSEIRRHSSILWTINPKKCRRRSSSGSVMFQETIATRVKHEKTSKKATLHTPPDRSMPKSKKVSSAR